jgi:hypothetical protein
LNIAGVVRNARCKGFNDGSINIAPSGGALPYQIEWTYRGELFGTDITNLDSLFAGTYFVYILDQNGCEKSTAFGVAEPPLLNVRLEETDTSLQALASGGVSPFRYFWNSGETAPVIDRPEVGEYIVTVIDNNGCQATDNLMITNTYNPEWIEAIRLYPNPTSAQAYLEVDLRRAIPLELRLYGPQGQLLYRREQAPALRQEIPIPLADYPTGMYFLTLHSEEGVLYSGKVIKR